jgi:predicted transposase/invertase (TIGR01784 family)
MTDHDHAFKELLGEFFPEFIDLFFPQVTEYFDRASIEFQPQEIFADLTDGKTYEADVVVKVCFRGQESYFIIHVEHQSVFDQDFDRRMFRAYL